MTYGRLAQLVEHLLDVQEVTGSSPVPSTTIPRPFGLGIFFVVDGTGLEQQRRRPLPAAETGRSCWGRILIFQSPAKGLRKIQQMQPVRPRRFPTRRNVYRDAGTVWGFFCGGRYRTRTARSSAAKVTKTPAGTGHPLPGGLYWEQQKKTEEQGSAEWCRKTG